MSILSDFEDRISNVVEGGFARVFRSPVQPAELARKLAREMDRRKVVGVGKVYAPTLYNVLLSPADDAQLGGFAETLAGELETYLVSEAREHSYAFATRPVVRFLVDKELKLGRFEVIGELLSPEEMAAELNEEWPLAENEEDLAAAAAAAALAASVAAEAAAPPLPTVTIRGLEGSTALRGDRMVVGRIASCDICLTDSNISRQHAAFVRDDRGWSIEDLGSTNGTLINGDRVESQRLRDGDVIVVGVTELVFREPRPNA